MVLSKAWRAKIFAKIEWKDLRWKKMEKWKNSIFFKPPVFPRAHYACFLTVSPVLGLGGHGGLDDTANTKGS
jgi:hypothetical protein